MKYFDSRKDGQISYNEFCDAVLDEDYTTQMMKMKPALKDGVDQEYARNAALKTSERSETAQVRQAVRAMQNIGKTFTLEEVQRTVLFVMPNVDLEKINY